MEAAIASIEPSLLPYLNTHAQEGIYIQFFLSVNRNVFSKTAGSERYPITHQRHARVTVGGRHKLLDVVCIFQPDGYCIDPSVLNPITNQDLENIWQQTWKQVNKMDADARPFALPGQIGKKGELIHLRPLLYCSLKDRYGHLLCPACGGPLILCKDDDLLISAGLGTYGGSLDRYLYCANCRQKEKSTIFYAPSSLETSSTKVRDSDALIEAFSRILAKSDLSDQLPCIGCNEAANCYGPESLVLKRMRPMQFFPFHMLMQRASTLNAVEFIALLSGAEPKELEPLPFHESGLFAPDHLGEVLSRLARGSGYLFGRDDRLFLEILYLKLTFLHELFALVRHRSFTAAGRMCLEGIGVEIGLPGSKLPGFWHFSLKLINPIGCPGSHPPGSRLPHFLTIEFLGRAWFYVLLANDKQSVDSVLNAIEQGQASVFFENADPGAVLEHGVFHPGNIFRHPRVLTPDPEWLPLWMEALAQGCVLARTAQGKDGQCDLGDFDHQLEQLRQRIHGKLFTASTTGRKASDKRPKDSNARIEAILKDILARWPQTSGTTALDQLPTAVFPQPDQLDEDGDFGQTVILSENDMPARVTEPPPGEAHTDLEQPSVISPRDHRSGQELFGNLEETVVTSPQPVPSTGAKLNQNLLLKSAQAASEPNGLEKTVIISPRGKSAPSPDRTSLPDEDETCEKPLQLPEAEQLKETVIIQPLKGRNKEPES
jgi:hypothetical protein